MSHHSQAARGAAALVRGAGVAVLTILLGACGPAVRTARYSAPRDPSARSTRTYVAGGDIAQAGEGGSAFDAILRLRPMYLRPSPALGAPTTRQPIVSVFVNDTYAGGPEALRTIASDAVESVRYLDRSEALRFIRLDQQGDGFIMVRLKRMIASQ